MALIQCKECGKEISNQANACPNCGAPTDYGNKQVKKERNKKRGNVQGAGCLIIILSIVLGLTVIGAPLAGVLFFIGLVILIVGFFV